MKVIIKRLLVFLLVVIILFCTSYVYADDSNVIIDIITTFITDFFNSEESLIKPRYDYVQLNDATAMVITKNYYNIDYLIAFNDAYINMTIDMINIKPIVFDNTTFKYEVYASRTFYYSSCDDDIACKNGMDFFITVSKVDGVYKIISLDTSSSDYIWFRDSMVQIAEDNNCSLSEAACNLYDLLVEALPAKVAYWEQQVSQFDNKEYTPEDDNTKLQDTSKNNRSVSVSFTRTSAVAYALEYGGTSGSNGIFKRMSPDCTNFVSQCLWAGYGGVSGYHVYDIEPLRQRVADNYRQISGTNGWFGRHALSSYAYSSAAFRQVVTLWTFSTGTHTLGPKATGYNNNKIWSDLTIVPRTGDVLQFYSVSQGRYYHSVIVTIAPSNTTTSNMLDKIRVAQHSSEYTTRLLRDALENNGGITSGKMRLMRYGTTSFNE